MSVVAILSKHIGQSRDDKDGIDGGVSSPLTDIGRAGSVKAGIGSDMVGKDEWICLRFLEDGGIGLVFLVVDVRGRCKISYCIGLRLVDETVS